MYTYKNIKKCISSYFLFFFVVFTELQYKFFLLLRFVLLLYFMDYTYITLYFVVSSLILVYI